VTYQFLSRHFFMKHEHPYAEHLPSSCAKRASPSLDADTEASLARAGDTAHELERDTAWDNWKSVRDVA